MRSSVLLPLPEGPRRTNISPSGIVSDTSRTTAWVRKLLLMRSSWMDMGAPRLP